MTLDRKYLFQKIESNILCCSWYPSSHEPASSAVTDDITSIIIKRKAGNNWLEDLMSIIMGKNIKI